ncbi:hypothetical protein OG2516_08858 [Oceanicola granulosus HTCC2516]|uniref:histidine kinase n=1 Tax=Oceanicola granulosus (strain ATCC BAA-861 / DSM 15982 / KCTC 12143 / HTCC2516) TaxID=314256 RepID=Q2CCS8_OCEGH|nr:HWE histidine kinase domain-containing protein [Oceanicola granulosus]EAR50435.1 hypothetical protein OG2516_08858 [Oceanicola granulosus HTCC2516]
MTSPETAAAYEVTLENCAREPIHVLGRIQPFGCLIAVSKDWIIGHASANTDDILDLAPERLVGAPFADFFPGQSIHDLRSKMQLLAHDDQPARVFRFDLFEDGRLFDIAIHGSGRHFVFEFEPKSSSEFRDDLALVQPLIARVRRREDIVGAATEAARCLKAMTGLDRVMVYRFEEDDSGTVIAEAREPKLEPFLHLRYPASDIPAQARELYRRNTFRIIADVDGEVHPIVPELGPDGRPLDLSFAVTRAVSPIHLEYLRNMGVRASLSVSILRRGKLWGLFACHHGEPFYVDYELRTAVELFGQLFSYELARLETDAELADVEKARRLHDNLMSQVSGGMDLLQSFDRVADEIDEVIPFDGIAIYTGGRYIARGAAPTEEEFRPLARFLNTAENSRIFHTDRIGARYPDASDFSDRVAGVLALPVSRAPRDYIVLFRHEVAQSVKWAGRPEKSLEVGPDGPRLTPRKSFEAWQEVVTGQSMPWKASELRAAESLRITLLEVVLKLSDEANANELRAREQQELLIAELNHRVRNILNLIRGLVSQGRRDAGSVDDYAAILDSRIHSLARAHDQLTERDWGWMSLKALIDNEVNAYLGGDGERVRVDGADVELSPTGFTTLALVMHELVTNSAKYGALSGDAGLVTIDLGWEGDDFTLAWRESGGPAVVAPTRQGFGTTIIERSIPFELKGTARTRYEAGGLEADFSIPAAHVRPGSGAPGAAGAPAPRPGHAGRARIEGRALVLDDNMIIAMDAADMLTALGARQVHVASSVGEAHQLLDGHDIVFALLDVNLGAETSLSVAERCKADGVHAVLATGYGASGERIAEFPAMPVLKKPYTIDHVAVAIEGFADGDG